MLDIMPHKPYDNTFWDFSYRVEMKSAVIFQEEGSYIAGRERLYFAMKIVAYLISSAGRTLFAWTNCSFLRLRLFYILPLKYKKLDGWIK